jgi:hypothetical protein
MFKIADNVISYYFSHNKKVIGLILSASKGWGLLNLKYRVGLVKNTEMHLFPAHDKSSINWLKSILFGFQKGYFQYIHLKGMGFKFIIVKNVIIFKLGYSHRILFLSNVDTQVIYLSKYLIKIDCRSITQLKQIVHSFLKIRKKNAYKKKGIFIKGSIIKLKLSSKKSKF